MTEPMAEKLPSSLDDKPAWHKTSAVTHGEPSHGLTAPVV